MSEATAIKYIETAPESAIKKLARALELRQEKIETDKAIKQAIADFDAGRFYTLEEFKKKHNLK